MVAAWIVLWAQHGVRGMFRTVEAVVMTALAVVLVLVLGTRLSSRTPPRADPQAARRP